MDGEEQDMFLAGGFSQVRHSLSTEKGSPGVGKASPAFHQEQANWMQTNSPANPQTAAPRDPVLCLG